MADATLTDQRIAAALERGDIDAACQLAATLTTPEYHDALKQISEIIDAGMSGGSMNAPEPDAREDYGVMDSRAQYDTDAAIVLEACGRKRPSWRSLSRDWGKQGAVLVRWYGWNGKEYTEEEVIGVIK